MKSRKQPEFDRKNLEAARIIAATPEQYGGPNAALVQWALLIIERAQPAVSEPPLRSSAA